jgi:hypothetical protein
MNVMPPAATDRSGNIPDYRPMPTQQLFFDNSDGLKRLQSSEFLNDGTS